VAALEKGVIIAAMITPPYDFVAERAGMKIFSLMFRWSLGELIPQGPFCKKTGKPSADSLKAIRKEFTSC
jgi:hypothetical protein